MSDPPQVSVLMPVRNGARWLCEAIDSVLTQSLPDLELIVVDDGSTDMTPAILAGYAERDSRVRLLHQNAEGLVCALNRGLDTARAPFVARLDSDDVALPHRLERQLRHLEAHANVTLLGSWAERMDDMGQTNRRLMPPADSAELVRTLSSINPFIHSSVMYRTAVARNLGGYRAVFEAAEDYDLWLRFSELGDIANLPELLVRYRYYATNVTSRKTLRQLFSIRLAQEASLSRRKSGYDPTATLATPPDWWALEADKAFYSDNARMYRFLELSDTKVAAEFDLGRVDLSAFLQQFRRLTHAERKLAQLAAINLLLRRNRPPGLSTGTLLTLLFRLHPARAVRLAWSALPGKRR
jgi:glycosyltransferase involved in cell wall biosynthesis